jgi:hypothetical protein
LLYHRAAKGGQRGAGGRSHYVPLPCKAVPARPSITQEKLLRVLLLRVRYTVRSARRQRGSAKAGNISSWTDGCTASIISVGRDNYFCR